MSGAKRLFDLCWTVVGLALLWPVFVFLSLIIALGDGGPGRQGRAGVSHAQVPNHGRGCGQGR